MSECKSSKSTVSTTSITKLGAQELAEKIRQGKVTPTQAVTASLDRIGKKNPKLNAFISLVDRDQLLKRAAKADSVAAAVAHRGDGRCGTDGKDKGDDKVSLPPLLGVPIAIKDLIDVKGLITTGGTNGLRGNLSTKNAQVIKQLKKAGAIIVGKTNLDELGFGVTGINFAFGPTGNAVNPTLFSGGSSSGSTVAVQSRMVPVALGSDTGGSSRIPASLCGVVGFRPSRFRYPIDDGHLIPISPTLDVVGLVARSAQDIRLVDGVLSSDFQKVAKASPPTLVLHHGTHGNTLSIVQHSSETKSDRRRPLRFGLPEDTFWDNIDASVIPAFQSALQKLASAGIELVPTRNVSSTSATSVDSKSDSSTSAGLQTLPKSIDMKVLSDSSKQIVGYEYFNALQSYLDRNDVKVSVEQIVRQIESPDVAARIAALSANPVSRDAYLKALNQIRPKYQKIYTNYLKLNQLDGILYPTTKVTAQPISESVFNIQLNGKTVPTFETLISTQEFAPFINIPALTLPIRNSKDSSSSRKCGKTTLPIGLEVAGAISGDDLLLSNAEVLESVLLQ